MPGFLVFHYLPEFTQIHVHWVSDAIQPSHPLLPLSFSPSIFPSIQSLFQWVGSLYQVAKVLELWHQHQSFQSILYIVSVVHILSLIWSVPGMLRDMCVFVFSLGQWRWWSFSNLSNLLTQSNSYQACFEVFWNSCLIKNLCPVLASITCILSPSREESLQR